MLTMERVEQYERAAMAMERHVYYHDMTPDIADSALAAWRICRRTLGHGVDIDIVDIEAARLLRECVREGRPLP